MIVMTMRIIIIMVTMITMTAMLTTSTMLSMTTTIVTMLSPTATKPSCLPVYLPVCLDLLLLCRLSLSPSPGRLVMSMGQVDRL